MYKKFDDVVEWSVSRNVYFDALNSKTTATLCFYMSVHKTLNLAN